MSTENNRRALRIAVYVLLVVSAATAFLLGDRLWAAARIGDVPLWAPLLAPCTFTVFVIVYALDRWMLVRRRASSLMRAIVQVAFAIIFLTLLWPQQASQYRQAVEAQNAEDYAVRLLKHPQAEVRAAACELLGLRAQISSYSTVELIAAADDASAVRERCRQALERLTAAKRRPEPIH